MSSGYFKAAVSGVDKEMECTLDYVSETYDVTSCDYSLTAV